MSHPLKSALSGPRAIAIGLCALPILGLVGGCAGPGRDLRGDPTLARDDLRSQRNGDRSEPYWPFQLARSELAAGERSLAQAYLDTALALDRDYAPALTLLSRIHYQDGRFAEAVALLQGYLDRHADAPDALRVALALNLQARDEPDRAAALLAACDTTDSTVRTARVFTHLQGTRFRESLAEARRAVERDPQSPANHNNLGISLLYAGRPEAAAEAFRRALALDPDLPGALYNMAIVENYYLFDPAAGRDYFARYAAATRGRPLFDPDDLAAGLGNDELAAGRPNPSGGNDAR